ncbi:hypothetical protein HJFPF1_07932 [Paramyrothecium foliicola]|nr:hypothetical protein HJFPF1_07932 [Paramyrothecium foliicola]
MLPLFQPPIFQTPWPPPPECRWHWMIPQPVSGVVLPTSLGAQTIPNVAVATTAATFSFSYYYYPTLLVHQPQPSQIPAVLSSPPPPPPPPPHRVGLTIRVLLHGRRRPNMAPGFWALALDAAYALAPDKALLFRDVAAWAAQHGLLAAGAETTPASGSRQWVASLYILEADESPAAGVVVDHSLGCVVVPAERVQRAVQLRSRGEGDGDGVREALEEARRAGRRAVLVVDVDAAPAGGAPGLAGTEETTTAGADEAACEEAVVNESAADNT